MEITTFEEQFHAQEIEITSVYFRNNPSKQRFESFPKRMVYGGREYTFLEEGLRFLVNKGQEFIQLFDVTDGQTNYRLRLDGSERWMLIDMKASV
jgi:hypothetical protein